MLSLVGLTVAIMGMIGLFSVAKGLDEMVSDTFGRIKGLVAMQPGAPIPLFSRLPAAWGAEIARVPGVSWSARKFGCGPTSSTAKRSSARPAFCSVLRFPRDCN